MKKICSMMIPLSLGIYLSSTTSLNASIQWLPDALEEGLKFSGFSSGGEGTDGGHGKGDGCDSKYNLFECPANGTCDRCAFANKYYLKECKSGYKISGNSCVAKSCSVLNASYLATIPANKICTKVTEVGLTCYKDCRNISCNGYSVNCDNIGSTTNVTSSTVCPDCQSTDANCTSKLCKITECKSGYKVNTTGSACVELSDICPSGYYKSCSTETIGTPEYTEKGTTCYQCKVLSDTCPSGYYKSCSTGTEGSPEYTEKGTACYKCKSSTSTPSCSGGIYDSSNCPGETSYLCGDSCNKKYPSCVKRPYPDMSDDYKIVNYCGINFTRKRDFSICPDYNTNSDFYNFLTQINPIYSIPYIYKQHITPYYACYNGDRACIDAYLEFQKNKEVTLDKDINCGILGWFLEDSGTYTINGNGHTVTFDKPDGYGFCLTNVENTTLNVNNTKFIFKNSNCSDFIPDVCYNYKKGRVLFFDPSYDQDNTINLTNVDVDISGSPAARISNVRRLWEAQITP